MKKRLVILALALVVAGGGAFLGIRHLRNSPEARLKRAERFFEDNKFQEARIEYMNVLVKDPQNGRALKQLASSWTQQGAPFAAIPFLVAAVEQNADDLELRQTLARTWFTLGQFEAARGELRTILEKDPAHAEALLLLTQLSFGDKRIEEVEELLSVLDPETSFHFHLAQATLARRRGETEAFKSSLEAASAIDDKDPEVQLAWALFHRIAEDLPAQQEALKKAADASPVRSDARLQYAGFLAAQDDLSGAIAVLDKVLDEADDYFPALLLRADLHRTAKEFDEALGLLERVIASDATNPNASWMKAQVFLDQRDREKAMKALEQLDARTRFPLTKFNLAKLYLLDGNVTEAQSKLKEAVAINPNYFSAVMLLAEIETRTGAADQAAGRLEALLKSEPDNLRAQLILANAYQVEGRLENAAEIMRGLTKSQEKSPGAHAGLGQILLRQNKPEEARLAFEKAQALTPTDQNLTLTLVNLDLARKDYESAHARVKAHLDREESWSALFMEGRILAAEGKWEESRASLFKALELNPGSLPVYSHLVGTYLAEKKPEEAISELEALVEANPSSLRHRMLLALLHEQQSDFPKAAEAYKSLLQESPDFVPALNNLAYVHAEKLDDLEKAEPLARKAHKLSSDAPAVADTLGWILYRQGKFAEAHPLIEKAAEKMSENQEIQYHLGMARLKMGMPEEAEAALALAAAGEAIYPGKDLAQQELAALRDPNRPREILTVAQLEERLEKNPSDVSSRLKLAQLHEANGAFEKAAKEYAAVTKVNSTLPGAWIGLARLYGGPLQDLDQAIDAGRKAHRLDNSNPKLAALLGRLGLQRSAKGDLPQSYGLLWEASKKDSSPQVRYDYARAAYFYGKLAEAREAMVAIVDASAGDPLAKEAESFLALTNPGEEGWSSLAALADKKLEADPENVPALMVKARLTAAEGVAICERLLKKHPDFMYAKVRLAALYARDSKRRKEAEALVRELLAASFDDSELATARAAIAYRKGDARTAIQYLEKSQATSPLDAEGLFYLGMAALKDGREDLGSKTLRQALSSDLDPALAKEARAVLGL